MSNPPISFRPGAPQQQQPPQYSSNMMAFMPGSYNPAMPYGAQFGQPQVPSFGMPIPGVAPFSTPQPQADHSRNTFFNRSTTGLLPQSMNYQHINHLKNLMPYIEKELRASNFEFVIVNNAENPGSKNFDLSIDVELCLTLGENKLPLKVQIPKEFPNQAPQLFSKSGVAHKLINKLSQEIDYNQYYPWEKTKCKVVELLKATDKYFRENSPFESLEGKKFDQILENIEERAASKLKELDVRKFYNDLSAEDKQIVNSKDQFKTVDLLKKTNEYKQVEESKRVLAACISTLAQTVGREITEAEKTYKDMKKAQSLTEESTTELNSLYTTAAVESQRFDKNNVVHSIEQYSKKIEETCYPEGLSQQLKEVCDKLTLDKTLNDFIKKRTEFNKMLIVKGKLTGAQLHAAN